MKDNKRGLSVQLNSSAHSVATQQIFEARNNRRSQQIKTLSMEFEDLKKKIKDIEKSHNNTQQTFENNKKVKNRVISQDVSTIVHFENKKEQYHSMAKKEKIQEQKVNEAKPLIRKNMKVKSKGDAELTYNVKYRKTEYTIEDKDMQQLDKSQSNFAYHPAPPASQFIYSPSLTSQYAIPTEKIQFSPFNATYQFPNPYHNLEASKYQNKTLEQSIHHYQQILNQQREKITILQRQLQQRQENSSALKKLQKKYNSLSDNYSQTIELCLQQFFDEVIKKRLALIDKCVRRNENKIKKMQIRIKDKLQDEKSKRLICQHRQKRSQSKSKRSSSSRNGINTLNNTPRLTSKRATTYQPRNHDSRSKQSEPLRHNQQFEEIATQYQEIIQIKTRQNENYQLRLKQKQKQLSQMQSKCAILQMKVLELTDVPKIQINRNSSEKQQNLLSSLIYDNELDILPLAKKISQLEGKVQISKKQLQLKDSNIEEKNKILCEYENKIKKNQIQINKLKLQLQKMQKQGKNNQNLKKMIQGLQSEIKIKDEQFERLKNKCIIVQNQKIKRQCQNVSLSNKIKKVQSELMIKEQKIFQLQKIIQNNGGNQVGDLLQKSIYLEKIDQQDIQTLQEEKQALEEQLLDQRQQIFLLVKNNQHLRDRNKQLEITCQNFKAEIETLQIHNESMRITLKAQQFQKYKNQVSASPLQKFLQQKDVLSEDDDYILREEFEDFKKRYEQIQNLLKVQKSKSFEENKKALKLTSELEYFKQQLLDRQSKYEKLRRQNQQAKSKISQLKSAVQEKENQLEVEKRINAQKIKQIQIQWQDFQQEINDRQQNLAASNLRASHLSSSSQTNQKNTIVNLNIENEKLLQKLKNAEKLLEIQKSMEEKFIYQNKVHFQKIKGDLRQIARQKQKYFQENQNLKRQIKLREHNQNRLKRLQLQGKECLQEQRIIELQTQLNKVQLINFKGKDVEQQLYNQIDQKEKVVQELSSKLNILQRRIQQLQDLLELKQINFNSNISTSRFKPKLRQSFQSHNSLKYSMLSNNTNRDKTIQLDLSQVAQSFYDQNQTIISNVSEVFAREQFPYEKLHLKRIQQRRLFQKTSAYIKSLKQAIDEKNKKIKLMQRKIQSLRNSQLIRTDIFNVDSNEYNDFQINRQDIFKDYYSVQLNSSHNQRFKFKQLQHETKLAIQENTLLHNQIESMQEQLLKAEEQEDSLMKLKDLYKDQIKNLIKQNQDQIKLFQEEIKKERQKNQQLESMQKIEAIKQIFQKIITAFILLQVDNSSRPKKKEQKKKQLQDFIKVGCNLLNYDAITRDKILNYFKQIKR